MKSALTSLLFVLALTAALGNEAGPPPLTPSTLAGTWEAVVPGGERVYLLDVGKTGPSHLVFSLGSVEYLCRLTSKTVSHGKITLRFRCLSAGSGLLPEGVVLTGQGVADETFGVFRAKVTRGRTARDGEFSEELTFAKPAWVDLLPAAEKRAKRLMREATRVP